MLTSWSIIDLNVRDNDGKIHFIVPCQNGRFDIVQARPKQQKNLGIYSQNNVGRTQDDEAVFKGRTSNIKGLLFWCSTLLSKVDKLEAASMYNAPLLSYFFFTRAYLKGTLGRGCKKLFGPIFGRLRAADTKVVVSQPPFVNRDPPIRQVLFFGSFFAPIFNVYANYSWRGFMVKLLLQS